MNDLYNFLQRHRDYDLRIRARNEACQDDALVFTVEWTCPCQNRETLRLRTEVTERTLQHNEREFFYDLELQMAAEIRRHTKPARTFDDGRTYFNSRVAGFDYPRDLYADRDRTHIDPAVIRRYCRPNGSSTSLPRAVRDDQMLRAHS